MLGAVHEDPCTFILLTATTNCHIWGYPFLQAKWSKAFRIATKVWNILYFNNNTKDNTLLHFHANALKIYYTVNSNIIEPTWHRLHCCVHCKLKMAMYLVKRVYTYTSQCYVTCIMLILLTEFSNSFKADPGICPCFVWSMLITPIHYYWECLTLMCQVLVELIELYYLLNYIILYLVELYGSKTWTIKASDTRRITAAEMEIHEKNSRIHLDRLQNKWTNCKGVKNYTIFGQITGIQEKLDTTCK